jgi:hypothetical protein
MILTVSCMLLMLINIAFEFLQTPTSHSPIISVSHHIACNNCLVCCRSPQARGGAAPPRPGPEEEGDGG